MNNRFKKALNVTLNILIAAGLTGGIWALGFVFPDTGALFQILVSVAAFLLIAMMAANFTLTLRFNKKLGDMTVQQQHDFAFSKKSEIENDSTRVRAKIKKYSDIAYAYYYIVMALLLFFSFCLGKLTPFFMVDSGEAVVLALLLMLTALFVFGLLSTLIAFGTGLNLNKKVILSKGDFPAIFECVKKAADKLGCGKEFVLFIGETTSITEYGSKIYITISPMEMYSLTKNEFYSIMLHEFAHFYNSDTQLSWAYTKINNRLGADGNTPVTSIASVMFLSFLNHLISLNYEILLLFISRQFENRADNAVKKEGMERDFINATAKLSLYHLFDGTNTPELNYYIYESETPRKDYVEYYYSVYEKYLEKCGERWNFIIKNRLPARIDTHPTFKQRMENMDFYDYDYTTKETDAAFIAERAKLTDRFNELIGENIEKTYKNQREYLYVSRKETLDNYNGAATSGQEISVTDKLNYADALMGIDYDAAERLLKEVLEKTPDNAQANYFMAVIKRDAFDESCVEYAYKAIESNIRYTDQALPLIGTYALDAGRQDLLDEYRNRAVELGQSERDDAKNSELTPKDKLVTSTLGKEFFDEFVKFLNEKTGDSLTELRCAKKKDYDVHIFGFAFKQAYLKNYEKVLDLMNDVNAFLSAANIGSYSLFFLSYRLAAAKLKKAPCSLIYSKKKSNIG